MQLPELIIILITIRNILITFRCIVMFILLNFHLATAHATVPYKQTDIQTDILCKRKEVPEGTPFTTNHIHFIEGSPVNKSVKYQNRGTMGVQIPFSFPKGLDFKPFQAKVRVLPWQINNTFILPILSPHIFSKPCKYWLSSLYTLFSKTAFFLINSCIFSCFFGHFGYKWVIFLIRKALRNKAFMSYLCIFWGYKPVFIQFFLRFFQPGSLF